ncbi:MAG: glucans biosynthesis glucosyltransferase MdoH [Rhodobacteraceae bacterium]|nr:glucans biosynthesis glucosyltransferase MdoH [Paracoccaceae bacterium]MBR25992.1 glucans biosynthesis glucosyltransferase MdoH [Paracoccaceae bacterium]
MSGVGAASPSPPPAPRSRRPGGGDAPDRPVPGEDRLRMVPQDLGRVPPRGRFAWPGRRVLAVRVLSLGGALAVTWIGADQMMQAFESDRISALQMALRFLFVLTFGWIAFPACAALAGLLLTPRPPKTDPDAPLTARTAIVMPVYNEDAAEVMGALAAMGRGLAALGHADDFEIFVISDTRDADAWSRETTAFAALREALGDPASGGMAAWYRRRTLNTGRKAGNVQDFVERWGGRYDFMLVLDADSLMLPETILEMVRRMQAAPRLGLLQTTPALTGAETPFAKLQEFAGGLYGPVVARGVSAWQGDDGNFWGHNAVIRVQAFADSAGLPELPGRKPFGGHVMSHDFVEAALLRRAGWDVRMDPDLEGSWEGLPQSLSAFSVRDRRWAQGNLQHAAVIGARGLRWPNRLHMAIGIGSYLASPVWLLMLLVGLAITVQASWYRPEYFPATFQLFPSWPRFDAIRMTWLFVGAMGVLLLPKFIGLGRALAIGSIRRRYGGGLRITAGAVVELLLSALIAPVMMLMQSRHVVDILLGRDSGWNPQTRDGVAPPWREAIADHAGHAAAGALLAAALLVTQPEVLIWLSPVVAGLLLAPILSRLGADPRVGAGFARIGLLDTPEARAPHPLWAQAEAAAERIRRNGAEGLSDLAANPVLAEAHLAALAGPAPSASEDESRHLAALTARAKIEAARDSGQALGWLTAPERVELAARPELLEALAARPAPLPAPPPRRKPRRTGTAGGTTRGGADA